jgi:subtilisin family serine protease
MPHHCPFPVRSTDNRRCYRTGSAPGFALSLALAAVLSGYASLGEAATVNAGSTPVVSQSILGWAKGRLLVAPRAGLSDAELDKALKTQNARSKGRFKQANIHVIELPDGADEVAAMRALQKDRRFKFVELDMAMAAAATVNDPNYSKSWALPKIQTPTAWDSANGSGVTIAILDSGMDSSHPDLAPNLVPGWNFYDNNSNTAETNGHGTYVAGVAAMVANNSKGSAGVAYGSKIMPVRIASPDGYAYASTMAQALYWAADNGARVANISYSGVPGNSTVQSAAQYMRSKGGYVVASAGNTGGLENVAAHDAILAVSATDQNDARASFSSYGPYVDVAAPGIDIYSVAPGGLYGTFWGTSFSSPIVAATAALVMSANSTLTAADIDKILKSTAVDLGAAGVDPYFGSGRIDAAKAVAMAKTYVAVDSQAPTISIASPTGGKVVGVVAVDVNYSDNVGVTRAELYVNGSKVASDDVGPFAFAWDTSAYADGAYSLVAKAYDAAGNVGASSAVSVTLGNDTIAPVVSSLNPVNGATVSASKATVTASATDNQGVAKISLTIDGKQVALVYGNSISYSWNTRKVARGAHTLTVRAWDAAGNTVSKSATVYR